MGLLLFLACVIPLTVFGVFANNRCTSVDCKCTDNGDGTWTADCSKRNLNSMPTFQMNVSKIDLSFNNLKEIGSSPQLPLLLKELSLNNNNLKSISAIVFQNLTFMEVLKLAGNNLWLDSSPKLSFIDNLSNLRHLDLLNNTSPQSNASYPFQSFKNLQNLKSLRIDGLLRGDFNRREWNLTSLTTLIISGKIGQCYFEKLEEGFFGGLPNIKYLTLTDCPIRFVNRGVFSTLDSLHALDLSNNRHMTFAVLENVSFDLQFTNVQILNVSKLHCKFGLGTFLSVKQIVHFRNTTITHLDLSRNRMELMDTDVPKYLPPNMIFLNISDNHLTWGMYMLAYQFLTNVRVADFSKQFSEPSDFSELDCRNSIDCTYKNDRNLDSCSGLSSDIMTTFSPHLAFDLSKGNYTFYIPRSLEKLFFHDSNFLFAIREIHLQNNHCKEYHLQNSIFNSLIGPMYGMEYAEYFDLSGNLMYNISQSFFDTFPNITYLNLSKNILGNCIHEKVGFDHFQALKKLKEIKLSYNGIESLPPNFLAGAWSLEILDLSHNLITNFTVTLNESTPLKYLDLTSNRLHILSHETMQRLQNIHERHNLTVALSANLFDCTCAALNFLQWIKDSKIHFIKKSQYICKTTRSRVLSFNNLDFIIKDLKQDCRSNIPRTIGITVSFVSILTVGIIGVLFKFRWTVRYYYYLTKWKIQEVVNPATQNQRNYKYSAFVAYTEGHSFVEQELVYQLEIIRGLKLCLPNRDFSPNLKTYASVAYAIHHSKKILCIVTSDFLRDSWCMYQLQMSLQGRVYRQDEDCIIFVLFEEPSFENLGGVQHSLLVMPFIEKNSYALYPQNETDHSAFWQKLVDSQKLRMAEMFYFIFFLSIVESLSKTPCDNEPNCDCGPGDQILFDVDCSKRGLTNLPSNLVNSGTLHSIDLSQNQLQHVKIPENYSITLKLLNLSYNHISELKNESFLWVPYLESLDLSNNRLSFNNTSLPRNVFQYLRNLKTLNLSHNNFDTTTKYNAELFRNSPSLKTLAIDGVKEGNFHLNICKEFKFENHEICEKDSRQHYKMKLLNLSSLTSLIVSGRENDKYCRIEHLTDDFFESFRYLEHLDLSGCSIKSVSKDALNLTRLKYLDLSYNDKLSFHAIPNISEHFIKMTNLKTLKLDKIHCTFGMGTYLTVDIVKKLVHSSITYLSIASNRLEMAEYNTALYFPPNLTFLNLSDNKLTFGGYVFHMKDMENLKTIDLSKQHTTHFTGVPTDFQECKNKPLCPSSSLRMSYKNPQPWEWSLPPKLQHVDYSRASLHLAIGKIEVNRSNSVKNISLNRNFLQNLTGPISGLEKVENIDFSYNFISTMSAFFFGNFPNLTTLNLRKNLIGKCIKTNSSAYFQNLTNLTRLDLSQNMIRHLPSRIFDGLLSLEKLNLSYNLLREFSLDEGQLGSLTELDLSNNELSSFPDSAKMALDSIQISHPVKIRLRGNDLRCSCDSLDLLKWMLNSKISFVERDLYRCQYSHTCQNLSNLGHIVKSLVKKCDHYEELIGVLSGLYVVFTALIVAGILYRYRWKLQYIYYMSKWSLPASRKTFNKIYEYDAFVSYADEERDFVTQEMISELEITSQRALCLHERDFTPGKSIGENITKSICNSRYVLCVVTENFLSSHWCMYELEMALTDNKYSRDKQSVFLIMYGGLPTENSKFRSSIRLMSLVEKNAYIEYPKDEGNKAEFWNSLRAMLQE
ncbi:uncharacterized protein LOC134231144 [Saccostrea cucullata]|uniref:uncharacterized protein LOC134231144 n=1 Tax=Saccostrea cuccullata TaxID=36930 RepID=UPI002ED60966